MSDTLNSIGKSIQQQVLDGASTNIRRMLLTPTQISLFKTIHAHGEVTTSFVVNLLGVSSQNASAKLQRLYNGGYLARGERDAETGGIEYVYEACVVWEGKN